VHLGCYYFSATGREFVFLADNTHEPWLSRYIGLDAIKFVPSLVSVWKLAGRAPTPGFRRHGSRLC
jgi:hypothetical protein